MERLGHISYLLHVTREAIRDLEVQPPQVSSATRKAHGVAFLRSDFVAVYWLALELYAFDQRQLRHRMQMEASRHMTHDEARALHMNILEAYKEERSVQFLNSEGLPQEEKGFCGYAVAELEIVVENGYRMLDLLHFEPGEGGLAHPKSVERHVKRVHLWTITEHRKVLARVANRLHDYLVRVEAELLAGVGHADLFDRNREFVVNRLSEEVPDAIDKLELALRLGGEPDSESWSLAATACRRALKAVTDKVYPPTTEKRRGHDGIERALDDSKWVNRLWQFAADQIGKSSARDLLQREIETLGERVEDLNELSSKGVHATLTAFEIQQCVVRTYMLIGDVLRLLDGSSGAKLNDVGLLESEIQNRLVE